MENTISQLEQILRDYTPLLTRIPEAEFSAKPLPQKWSRKEVLWTFGRLRSNQYTALHCSAI